MSSNEIENLQEAMMLTQKSLKYILDILNINEKEHDKFKKGFAQIYTCLQKMEKAVSTLNNNLQMIKLEIAKDSNSGHS